jgi:UDP-N-acetylglucosamine diphosphorylase / glucose-1-phosphate thymidylyltransferase / UDP-N-acetylgalactosamine diphosphorylase / glucosamine-1-phosphate N-acetyltransferase / galactosamine-1-phosphate N-acetyltransferase
MKGPLVMADTMFSPSKFFDIGDFEHRALFNEDEPVWTAIKRLPDYFNSFFEKDWPLKGFSGMVTEPLIIVEDRLVLEGAISLEVNDHGKVVVRIDDDPVHDAALIMPGAYLFDDRVLIGAGTVVEPGALIKGPAIIGRKCEIRQGAYFRGHCLVGDECLVGHATEIKNSIMLKGSKAGHFAYLGDSILGAYVNLGAGTKLANLKMVPGTVSIRTHHNERISTGMRKLGAILGDGVETGCNSVTSPGTFIGKGSRVLPCVNMLPGYYPDKTVIAFSDEALKVREITKAT